MVARLIQAVSGLSETEIKVLLRSRSWQFLQSYKATETSSNLSQFDWKGIPLHFRSGTSDPWLIYHILLKTGKKSEYFVPGEIDPGIILDIGANIGITSVYFAQIFPTSKIYSFEPVPDNCLLLEKNTENLSNIVVSQFALGSEDGDLELYYAHDPTNHGGFSFYKKGSDASQAIKVPIRNASKALAELEIDRVDLIKIDTEGSEYEVLMSIDRNILKKVKYIIGELHGERDFELLSHLSEWFDIGVKKSTTNRVFMFNARNKILSS